MRDLLDSAIRSLAISTGSVQERVCAAASILLDQLAPADFRHEEEHKLLCQIRVALTPVGSTPGSEAVAATFLTVADPVAERVASEIVDLRDMHIGRAIREAATRGHPPRAERRGVRSAGRRRRQR